MQTGHPVTLEDEERPPIIVNDKDNRDDPIIVDDRDDGDDEDDEYQPTMINDDGKKDDDPQTRTRQQRDDPDKILYTNAEDEVEIKNNLLRCCNGISRRYEENQKDMEKVEEYLTILGRY
jgi:hypothetical protein